MARRLLMRRQFLGPTGGHQKMFDYFGHACAHPNWSAQVHFTGDSVDASNPWRAAGASEVDAWHPDHADALLLGGMDWEAMPPTDGAVPVINLVQHVRHADPALPLRGFLRRRALRICVSKAVAEAILATGEVNGPVQVIDAAITDVAPGPGPRTGVFIDAIKQPMLGQALAQALAAHGIAAEASLERMPRDAYVERLRGCEVAVLLPHATEGFYLPGVEAMAAGAACVVPDCIGNRGYLQPGINALVPALELDGLLAAVLDLGDHALRARLRAAGGATAARYGLARERAAFHAVLDAVPMVGRAW